MKGSETFQEVEEPPHPPNKSLVDSTCIRWHRLHLHVNRDLVYDAASCEYCRLPISFDICGTRVWQAACNIAMSLIYRSPTYICGCVEVNLLT